MEIENETVVRITPAGRVLVAETPELEAALGATMAKESVAAFEESSAVGVLWLVSRALHVPLPAAFTFWRELGRRYFEAEWQSAEDLAENRKRITAPLDELQAMTASAPPMRGLEYLSAELLEQIWHELHAWVVEQSHAHPEGPEAYVRSVSPVWRLLGRVTFHLAENKRDAARPFAFLATYTHRVSAVARLQHLPLGQALKEYAGERNQTRLVSLLEPVQRAAESSPLVREMLDTRALFHPQSWSIGEAYRFLSEVPTLEAAGLVVRVPDWWNPRRPHRPQVQVRIGQQSPSSALGLDGLLDFRVDMALDGEPLTAAERRQILDSGDGLMLLRGKWVEVGHEKLHEALEQWQRLLADRADGLDFIQGMRLLAGAPIDAATEEDGTPEWSRIVAGDWLRETLRTLCDPSGTTSVSPGTDLRATLRPYQADGVRWLRFLTKLGLGACLADDMGLGKTIQVIDLLLHIKRESSSASGKSGRATRSRDTRPSLLIVPSSLIGNWKQELERFGPTLEVFCAHRSECDADTLQRVAAHPRRTLADFDLVVTTYGLVRRSEWLRKVAWRLVVLDEAQAIKNPSAAQTRAVKKLPADGRIVLTGTPIENHLGDLWSLFDFCNPGLLGSAAQFKKFVNRLNQKQDATAYGSLRRLVRPYILRRLKTDPGIVPDLPDKTRMRVECGLSKKQAALYERAVEDLAKRVETVDGMARRGLVLATLMQLKQICNHPAQYLNQTEYPPDESGKFMRLAEASETIAERQERVLVFTQFQSMCGPLAAFLEGVFGQKGLVLHGRTPVAKRTRIVQEFQDDGGPPFLVISVKAGGSGLNLTAASHVVHFDRWWNPAVENQATDRAFRIGQKRNVLVHEFVCRGTVEERIDEMLRSKQVVADRILDAGAETKLTELNDEELLRFLSIDLNRATVDE